VNSPQGRSAARKIRSIKKSSENLNLLLHSTWATGAWIMQNWASLSSHLVSSSFLRVWYMISCTPIACTPGIVPMLDLCYSVQVLQQVMSLTLISHYLETFVFWHNYFDGDLILQYKVMVVEAWLMASPVFQCPFCFKVSFAILQIQKQLSVNLSSGLILWLPGNSRGGHLLLHQLSPCATYDDKLLLSKIIYYLYCDIQIHYWATAQ
jgi:hypothetical protein